jgi:hypothetical protein
VGLEDDREPLVGLELGEGPGRRGDPVTSLGMLHRAGALAQQALEQIVGIVPPGDQEAFARSADRQCLPTRDDLHPCDEGGGWTVRRLRQQDLDRALEGVLGVVDAQRQASRRASKGGLGHGEQGERPLAAPAGKRGVVGGHIPDNPWPARAALRTALAEARRPSGRNSPPRRRPVPYPAGLR